jgi:signal recognition particle receptor subunit beta
MPLDLGTVAGMRTCFQVYTVPGQVYYNSTRKLVLQGVDGVIFIADSSAAMLDQNLESLRNLEENLNEYGKSLATIPHVIQFNKRDLPDAMPVEELNRNLNHHGAQTFEAIANSGQGVFPTLKSLAATVLKSIMQEASEGKPKSGPSPATSKPAAAPSAAPAKPAFRPQAAPAAPMPARAPSERTPAAAAAEQHGFQPAVSLGGGASKTPAPGLQMQAQKRPQQSPTLAVASPHQSGSGGDSAGSRIKRPSSPTASISSSAPAQRRSRPHAASAAEAPAPKKKSGAAFTGIFIALAAGAGALIAWFVLKAL